MLRQVSRFERPQPTLELDRHSPRPLRGDAPIRDHAGDEPKPVRDALCAHYRRERTTGMLSLEPQSDHA
jgi:hypothetical protein